MKNKILYIAFAIFAIVSCTKDTEIEIPIPTDGFVQIPDANFEKELVLQGIDSDGIVNQKILKSDSEKVEKLSIYSSNINTLKGVEAFVNLKRLYAEANYLTTIDLSNNILLDTIHLGFNELTSIKGLNNAKNLKWLSLSGNLFTEFTIENPSIRNLLMSHNELVSFEASQCPNLRSVLLKINKIESLDFSNSPLLETLIFSANRVKSIDVSNNLNLKYVWCSSNLFTNFDVSKLTKLADLRVDRNPTLNCIKIAPGQQIPTLKLSDYQTANINCN